MTSHPNPPHLKKFILKSHKTWKQLLVNTEKVRKVNEPAAAARTKCNSWERRKTRKKLESNRNSKNCVRVVGNRNSAPSETHFCLIRTRFFVYFCLFFGVSHTWVTLHVTVHCGFSPFAFWTFKFSTPLPYVLCGRKVLIHWFFWMKRAQRIATRYRAGQ